MTNLPDGYRIVKSRGVIKGYTVTYWVVLGALDPNREDPDDFTQPEASDRYVSKKALLAALANGTANLVSNEEGSKQ